MRILVEQRAIRTNDVHSSLLAESNVETRRLALVSTPIFECLNLLCRTYPATTPELQCSGHLELMLVSQALSHG
jgi:hypothetical protein